MSLFRTKDWWRAADVGGSQEECEANAFCYGNLDNDPRGGRGGTKLAVGTLGGLLRIYAPRDQVAGPSSSGAAVENASASSNDGDSILEVQLQYPILQLECGRFSPDYDTCIAVLHPKHLVVYTLTKQGSAQDLQNLILQKVYEHKLERSAANMCCGPFGRKLDQSTGYNSDAMYDDICVQSLDGQLSIFEANSFAFSRFLGSFVVAGPLTYCRELECFFTVNAAFELECYKYQTLTTATMSDNTGVNANSASASANTNAVGGQTSGGSGSSSFKYGKKLEPNWRFILGEGALDIQCGRLDVSKHGHGGQLGMKHHHQTSSIDIVVLGERTLFVLSSEGQSKMQRKLEYSPTCLAVYPIGALHSRASNHSGDGGGGSGGNAVCNIVIATSTGYLMVYNSERLIWSAKHDLTPISINVVEIGSLGGLLVTMDELGMLAVSYLGTDPPTQVVAAANANYGSAEEEVFNFEEMESEHRQLLNVIRQHATEKPPEPVEQLMIRAQIPQYLKQINRSDDLDYMDRHLGSSFDHMMDDEDSLDHRRGGAPSKAVMARIYLNYSGLVDIKDVSVSIQVPEPLVAEPSHSFISSIKGGNSRGESSSSQQTPIVIQLTLYPGGYCLPTERTVNISASYSTPNGEPRITHCECDLPLCLFGELVTPIKHASHKITLDTNRDAPQLSTVFEDLFAAAAASSQETNMDMDNVSANANVMSFKYFSGEVVTTIVSKNAGRYRIQSDSHGAMWLVLQELKERLVAYYAASDQDLGAEEGAGEGQESFQMTLNDNVPLDQLFESIDEHFNSVEYVNKLHSDLEVHGKRFRAVQKRLLVRFKDRRPEPLSHMEALLDDTYDKIVDCCTQIDESTLAMTERAREVAHNCHLFLSLLQCQFGLSEKDVAFLKNFINPQINHNAQGDGYTWEEYSEASLTYLLKAHLSKSQKDTISFGGISKITGTNKLKKLFSTICERFSRGFQLHIGTN